MRFWIDRHGCAKNDVDGEEIAARLDAAGHEFVEGPESADLVIVNTCGFIEDAKRESIGAVVALKAAYPGKRVLVAGCLSQRYAADLAADLPEADGIVGNADLGAVLVAAEATLAGERPVMIPAASSAEAAPSIGTVRRVRRFDFPGSAHVKATEGCSNFCSFCAIPLIRGRLRSRKVDDVLAECLDLVSQGVRELVLIGQDLGSYGRDLSYACARRSPAASHPHSPSRSRHLVVRQKLHRRFPRANIPEFCHGRKRVDSRRMWPITSTSCRHSPRLRQFVFQPAQLPGRRRRVACLAGCVLSLTETRHSAQSSASAPACRHRNAVRPGIPELGESSIEPALKTLYGSATLARTTRATSTADATVATSDSASRHRRAASAGAASSSSARTVPWIAGSSPSSRPRQRSLRRDSISAYRSAPTVRCSRRRVRGRPAIDRAMPPRRVPEAGRRGPAGARLAGSSLRYRHPGSDERQ